MYPAKSGTAQPSVLPPISIQLSWASICLNPHAITVEVRLPRDRFPGSCNIRNHSITSITDNLFLPALLPSNHPSSFPTSATSIHVIEQSRVFFDSYFKTPSTTSITANIFTPAFTHPATYLASMPLPCQFRCLSREALLQSYYIRTYSAVIITANVFPSVLSITCCLSLYLHCCHSIQVHL